MSADNREFRQVLNNTPSLLAVYNKQTGLFTYHDDLATHFGRPMSDKPLWDFLQEEAIVSATDAAEIKDIIFALDEINSVFFKVFPFGVRGRYILSFTYAQERVVILFKLFDQGDLDDETIKYDELTRLIRRNHFCTEIARINQAHPHTPYALVFFDLIKFKAINDIFGFSQGDALLMYIADILRNGSLPIVCACRTSADRFAFLADITSNTAEEIIEALFHKIKEYKISFDITFNAGVYTVPKTDESGDSMLNKATLAERSVKGNFAKPIGYFTERLRDEMLTEQEITGEMATALAQRQFAVYYQPQYNHSTGMLVGAEALVRWQHPTKGMVSPADFIPIFEKNGTITKLDFYVFERVAEFLRACLDNHYSVVPISVNFSRHDIFSPAFVETLERIRTHYGIPASHLRIEITEGVLTGNNSAVNDILTKLHACGYVIEMDDFGSGYSSLNVLKDLDFDVIKLDMLFLENNGNSKRGGTILSSVINMAKWLHIPVIAEGVETREQADFLRSIGCNYIQGYLYSCPLPQADYEALVSCSHIGTLLPQMKLVDTLNTANFWDPSSQETLIFNNFAGAAAIFTYDRATRRVEILRVNQKYLRELGMNLSEREIIHSNPADTMDDANRAIYADALKRAMETGDEQECRTWRDIRSDCCGTEHICIHSTVCVIGQSETQVLFYTAIRNITAEQQALRAMEDSEKRFKMASEQVNIYFWEYTIATKEMRPCFRCMRDLGLPPLLRNYPDSAIERGVFPPEVADMYRDWHVQIANGVRQLEAVMPLTVDRIPFRVKYTTEYDENGHPIKAYGSAAQIINET